MKQSCGYYQLKCGWMETGAYLYQEGGDKASPEVPWQWNGIFISRRLLDVMDSKKYKDAVLHAVTDDLGGVTIAVEDNGDNGDGVFLSLLLPETSAKNERATNELLHVHLPDQTARILMEALATILRLREAK